MPKPDTLKQSKQLQQGGAFTPEQADLLTNALVEATSHLATRDDLYAVTQSLEDKLTTRFEQGLGITTQTLRGEMNDLSGALRGEMNDLRVEMKDLRVEMKEMQYNMIKAMLLIVSLALALDVALSQLL